VESAENGSALFTRMIQLGMPVHLNRAMKAASLSIIPPISPHAATASHSTLLASVRSDSVHVIELAGLEFHRQLDSKQPEKTIMRQET
jgi:hypothetical protein